MLKSKPQPHQGPSAQSQEEEQKEINETLERIKHKIIVLSGKGGVGKSTVAVNLAATLAANKKQVGLLDIDIHGPSVPKLLNLEGNRLAASVTGKLLPVEYNETLKVISIGFLLENKDSAIVWRGPLKYGAIKQFIKDVNWGDLDFLVVDSPPGTGDEPLSVCQLITNPDGAVIVTTPQDVAILDVRKSVNFCRQLNIPILGVIENMSGFVCPHCGKETKLFKSGGGQEMAEELGIPFLGHIPLEASITELGDSGTPFTTAPENSTVAKSKFQEIINKLMQGVKQ